MTTRNFAPISIEDLIVKIKGQFSFPWIDTHALLQHLGSDIKVTFDLENVSDSPKDFGPKTLMGFHTEANGLTYCGMCAGGDWEHPVFFCVYWDGKKLRGYVPTEGNPWNTTTNTAYGNDEKADLKNARKRWPDKFGADTEEVGSGKFVPDVIALVNRFRSIAIDFDPELIRKDIIERLLPQGQKPPGKVKTRKPDKLPTTDKLPPTTEWTHAAEECMNALLDAHEKMDKDGLGRALQGMRILLGRTPGTKTN